MGDISGFGLTVRILASNTFPTGFDVTEFASDSDPLDFPNLVIGEDEMGLNGDLITWGSPNAIGMVLNVIPGGDNDNSLAILFEANRTGKGKRGAQDTITAVATYPNGSVISVINGHTKEYTPGKPVTSAGRLKTKTYIFAFENKVEV